MSAATVAFVNSPMYGPWAKKVSGSPSARIKRIAAILRQHDVDIIGFNELVTYKNAEAVSNAMGWGGQRSQVKNDELIIKKGDSCMLRGSGHAGVAMGWIWDPSVLQPYWAKEIDTYPGWNRNRYALAMRARLLQQNSNRVGLGLFHLEFFPKGPNNIKKYDDIRYEQVDGFLDDVQSPHQSWFVGGDENHSSKDKPDAPGNAAKKHGLVNVDTGNIIRAQKTKDIRSAKPYMVSLGSASDHPALIIPGVVVPK